MSSLQQRSLNGGIFYGWFVVAGVFLTLSVTSGLGFYNASVILQAGKEELDASVSAVSGATALFFGVSGITGFAGARLMDRIDLRWFYLAGGIIGAASLVGLHWVASVAGLYVFFSFFGMGFALAGLVPGTTAVTRWFAVRRSVALSIATIGLSVGGIALTPIAAALIDRHSLSGAGPWMGLAWLSVIPLSLLIRSEPSALGLEPDGKPRAAAAFAPSSLEGATFEEASATRFFRFLSVAYALIFMAQVGALAQLFNLTTERVDRGAAAAAISTLALSSVVGRLIGGVLVTKVPAKQMTAVLVVVQAIALALIAASTTRTAILVSSAIFGLSVGNLLMLQPLLLAEAFGVKHYSRVYSFNQLFGTIGVAGGPFLLGFLRDQSSYETAMYVGSALNLAALAVLIAAGPVSDAQDSWSNAAVPVAVA